MGMLDYLFSNGDSKPSAYDSKGNYNPGEWRKEYDKENWRMHRTLCDHFDEWQCDNDDHF